MKDYVMFHPSKSNMQIFRVVGVGRESPRGQQGKMWDKVFPKKPNVLVKSTKTMEIREQGRCCYTKNTADSL